MQQKSLPFPVRPTKPVALLQSPETQVRRVVHDQNRSLSRSHATQRGVEVRFNDLLKSDILAVEEAIKAFELAVVRRHSRKTHGWGLHRPLSDSLEPAGPSDVAELSRSEFLANRHPCASVQVEHLDLRSSLIRSVKRDL
jgi:hypothetical protein